MSEIARFQMEGIAQMTPFLNGEWVRYADHLMEAARLTGQNSKYWAKIERMKNAIDHLTSERDEARAEVQRLITERDQTANRPKGREMMRVGLGDAYVNPIPPPRPSDEDIWRETLMTLLPSYPWEKAAAQADCVLADYRKRWPR